jgi:plastocyanin
VLFATIGRKAHLAEIEESMQRKSLLSLVPVLILLALPGLMVGCSSKDKGTNPMATTEPFESGDLASNGTANFVHVFGTAGSFGYRCRHHPVMTATVTVSAGGADSAVVPIADFAFGAPTVGALPIKPGGKVKWVSLVTTLHTVTRP